jgi:hypothetical protein
MCRPAALLLVTLPWLSVTMSLGRCEPDGAPQEIATRCPAQFRVSVADVVGSQRCEHPRNSASSCAFDL